MAEQRNLRWERRLPRRWGQCMALLFCLASLQHLLMQSSQPSANSSSSASSSRVLSLSASAPPSVLGNMMPSSFDEVLLMLKAELNSKKCLIAAYDTQLNSTACLIAPTHPAPRLVTFLKRQLGIQKPHCYDAVVSTVIRDFKQRKPFVKDPNGDYQFNAAFWADSGLLDPEREYRDVRPLNKTTAELHAYFSQYVDAVCVALARKDYNKSLSMVMRSYDKDDSGSNFGLDNAA
eukprot:jgi/Bigna1/70551/fgenesh1_pg.12_\